MDLTYSDAKPIAIFLAVILTMYVLNVCSYAYFRNTTATNYEFYWPEESKLRRVKTHLQENGWVDERVTDEELDYICLLAKHLSSYYDNIPWTLALATIAQESKFYQYDEYDEALGLMQLLPYYHRERLIQCLEEDERYSDELFYDPRLNVMTGLDYLSQLINECDGDICYALMCYNQGPSSAYKTYKRSGITSNYAKNIAALQSELGAIVLS